MTATLTSSMQPPFSPSVPEAHRYGPDHLGSHPGLRVQPSPFPAVPPPAIALISGVMMLSVKLGAYSALQVATLSTAFVR